MYLQKSSFHGEEETGLRIGRCPLWSTVPQVFTDWEISRRQDLDSLAAAAVDNAAVSASSWPESKGCGRRRGRWRGGCWRGLALLQERVCIQRLQRELIEVVCGYKEKHRTSSCSIYITAKASWTSAVPSVQMEDTWERLFAPAMEAAAPSLCSPMVIQVYCLFSGRLFCNTSNL